MQKLMMLNPDCRLYIGDRSDNHIPSEYLDKRDSYLTTHAGLVALKQQARLDNMVFLHQVHGVSGAIVYNPSLLPEPFSYQGDFIITSCDRIGLGVMTADCLPLIMINQTAGYVGIAHVGWRGAVQGVVKSFLSAVDHSTLKDCRFILGPSARPCCYEVGENFLTEGTSRFSHFMQSCRRVGNQWYFDLPDFVISQLVDQGIERSAIDATHNQCTICNHQFCSYRREQEHAGRQMTVVWLDRSV